MKKSVIACMPVLLAACVTNPSMQDRAATLNVYEDNTVAISVKDVQGRTIYAINEDKDRVVAFEAEGRLYNLIDIARVTGDTRKGSKTIEVTMADGRTKQWFLSPKYPRGAQLYFCDRQKKCAQQVDNVGYVPLTAGYAEGLYRFAGGDLYKSFPRSSLLPDSLGVTDITVLRNDALAKLKNALAERRSIKQVTVQRPTANRVEPQRIPNTISSVLPPPYEIRVKCQMAIQMMDSGEAGAARALAQEVAAAGYSCK